MVSSDAEALKQIRVNRLDGNANPQAPAKAAVVMVANKNFDYTKSPADWREKLANPAWKVVNEGVGKEASLQKVSNFDAQVHWETGRAAIYATRATIMPVRIS